MSAEPLSSRFASAFSRLDQLALAQRQTTDVDRRSRISHLQHRQVTIVLDAILKEEQATAAGFRRLEARSR